MGKLTLNIISILALLVFASELNAQGRVSSNSLFRRAAEHSDLRGQMGSASSEGNNNVALNGCSGGSSRGISVAAASWYSIAQPSPKGFHVHDLVTIMVNEISSHSSKADTKSERSWELDASIDNYITLTAQALRPASMTHGKPTVGMKYEKEFEGKGDVKRQDSLSAQIMAEIVDVLPNGNLLLEATSTVMADGESTAITLSGMCRTKDVTIANTILSSQLANLSLTKVHQGIARDATKRGFLSGIIDALTLF